MPNRPAETVLSQESMTTTNNIPAQTKPLPEIKPYGPNAIDIQDLTFAYNTNAGSALIDDNLKNILQGLNLTLETGSRCLLIGANGRYVLKV